MGLSQHVKSTGVVSFGIGALVTGSMFLGGGVAHADPVQVTASGSVNVRSAPSTDSDVLGTFGGGQRVEALGAEENGWIPVLFMGDTAYIAAEYVTPVGTVAAPEEPEKSAPQEPSPQEPAPQEPAPQKPAPQKPAPQKPAPQKPAPQKPAPAPAPDEQAAQPAPQQGEAGTKYSTAQLNVRSAASTSSRVLATLRTGDAVETTGRTQGEFTEIRHGSGTAWVATRYLSADEPAAPEPAPAPAPAPAGPAAPVVSKATVIGRDGLQPNTVRVLTDSQQRFPQIQTYGGVRPDALPDHPSGRALDIMLPDYRNNQALGQEIADYYRAHAAEFDINYIIFDQHIWSVARSGEGWRLMADRGSDNANHRNHVHITVN